MELRGNCYALENTSSQNLRAKTPHKHWAVIHTGYRNTLRIWASSNLRCSPHVRERLQFSMAGS